jgi:hypothetical protein
VLRGFSICRTSIANRLNARGDAAPCWAQSSSRFDGLANLRWLDAFIKSNLCGGEGFIRCLSLVYRLGARRRRHNRIAALQVVKGADPDGESQLCAPRADVRTPKTTVVRPCITTFEQSH